MEGRGYDEAMREVKVDMLVWGRGDSSDGGGGRKRRVGKERSEAYLIGMEGGLGLGWGLILGDRGEGMW